MSEKLQKVLARAGLGSRRGLEGWIAAGRVSVNGKVAKLGDRVEQGDQLRVDGRPLSMRRATAGRRQVLIYHKPVGQVTSHKDSEGRPTVFDNLPKHVEGRWIAIGRLDITTLGLLLFTNDGDLANRLMHPSSEVEREYAVRVHGEVSREMTQALLDGVELDDGTAQFDSVKYGGGEGRNQWYHVTLHGGRNREVRRLWESQGVEVSRLIRTRYGPVKLPRRLPQGHWEEMDERTLKLLLKSVGMDAREPATNERPGDTRGGAGGVPGIQEGGVQAVEEIAQRGVRASVTAGDGVVVERPQVMAQRTYWSYT